MKPILLTLINAVENLQIATAMLAAKIEGKDARAVGELVAGKSRADFDELRKQVDALPTL